VWRTNAISASSLRDLHIEPPREVVGGLVSVGLNILAGNPKSGKSFLALALAHAVAIGKDFLREPTAKGGVLYLALEDTHYRLQNRTRALGLSWPENLYYIMDAPTLAEGGLELIHDYLHDPEHEERPQLVVIDTLARIRDPGMNENVYMEDSALGAALQATAFDGNAAILVVHHMRKASHSDFLLSLSGSAGLPGAADVVMALERERNESTAMLHVTGRDISERAMTLCWSRNFGGWQRA
jgi:RecA-family ATPase